MIMMNEANFLNLWEELKGELQFERVSLLLNGRRRWLVNWLMAGGDFPKRKISMGLSIKRYLIFLLTAIPFSADRRTHPVAVIYGPKRANVAGMIEKVTKELRPEIKPLELDLVDIYSLKKNYLRIFGFNFWSDLNLSLRYYLAAIREIKASSRVIKNIGLARAALNLLPESARLLFYRRCLQKAGVRILLVPNETIETTELWSAAAVLEKIAVMVMQHGVLFKTYLPSFATKFFVWGEESYRLARRLGFNPDNLEISGAACFEPPKPARPPLSRGGRLRFLFFSQANLPDIAGPESCQGAREWLFDVARTHPEWRFVIRLHPTEFQGKFYEHPNRPPNIIIEDPKSVKVEDSIAMSDVCGTIWSGAGLDCMLIQRPLVQFLGQDWPERLSWYRQGIPRAASSGELALILDRLTQDDEYKKKVLTAQSGIIKDNFSNFHGEKTVAEKIREYLNRCAALA